MSKKKSQPKRYVISAGGRPLGVSHDFHDLPVPVMAYRPHVWTNLYAANHALRRLLNLRERVRGSMISDFKGFKPLFFNGERSVDQFYDE